MKEASSITQGWFAGRIPDGWFNGPPEVTYDREEILVLGEVAEPELGADLDDEAKAAARRARIEGFREDTRSARMRIADAAEHKFGRKVAWGARCGGEDVVFTTLSIPVIERAPADGGAFGTRHARGGERRPQSQRSAGVVRAPGPRPRGRLDPAAPRRPRPRGRGSGRRPRTVDRVARRYARTSPAAPSSPCCFRVALVSATVAGTLAAPAGGEGTGPLPEVDFAAPSLSAPGRALAEASPLAEAPRYALVAAVNPKTGAVAGRLRADLPVPTDGELHFRVFAGLLTGADLAVDDVAVDAEAVDARLDASLLTVPVPAGESDDRVEVSMRFSYLVPEVETGADILGGLGEGLDPAEVGLLARHRGGVTLGHWFPVWLPPTASAEAEPDGFGDIGNFPAAIFGVRVTVPDGWGVVSGGVNVDRRDDDDGVTFVEEGTGLRDFALFTGRSRAHEDRAAGDVAVRVTAPRTAQAEIAPVGEEVRASLATFTDGFGPYPWAELDVVSVPLGSSVAGMEWPGMIWIESTLFAGGIPGLGDLGDLEDLGLGDLGLPGLEGLDSTREFVVAHEVAHQWWHTLVGNDSISAPVVDEPLAQYSACLYFEREHPNDGGAACTLQTDGQYQTMRALGEVDAPADQPSDAFTSSLQYGGVVYGKAPGLYRALGELLGPDAVLAGLEAFAGTHTFGVAGPDDLRAALVGAAPGRAAEIDAVWLRWIDEAHGDEDIGVGSLPGLDPGPIDPEQLDEILELLEGLPFGGEGAGFAGPRIAAPTRERRA